MTLGRCPLSIFCSRGTLPERSRNPESIIKERLFYRHTAQPDLLERGRIPSRGRRIRRKSRAVPGPSSEPGPRVWPGWSARTRRGYETLAALRDASTTPQLGGPSFGLGPDLSLGRTLARELVPAPKIINLYGWVGGRQSAKLAAPPLSPHERTCVRAKNWGNK